MLGLDLIEWSYTLVYFVEMFLSNSTFPLSPKEFFRMIVFLDN